LSESIYVDSNVFILPILYGDSQRRAIDATRVLRKIETKEIAAYTSLLTWDEVTWVVSRTMGKSDSREAGKRLLQFPNLRFVGVNESVVAKSQSLIEEYEIRPRDSIHCASALAKGIKEIVSDDADFETIENIMRVPLEVAANHRSS
jgi:uncharacterized protein